MMSDDERRVLEVIRRDGKQGIALETIYMRSMLDAISVVRACLVLIQRRHIRIREDTSPKEIILEPAR